MSASTARRSRFAGTEPYEHDVFVITTNEDWLKWVNAEDPQQPRRLTPKQFSALSATQRQKYARLRTRWHIDLPFIPHDEAMTIDEALIIALTENNRATPGPRELLLINAPASSGKSAILTNSGRDYHRYLLEVYGDEPPTVDNNNWVPVVYVSLGADTDVKQFNQRLCHYYGVPAKGSAADMTLLIQEFAKSCGTALFMIDDIHRMKTTEVKGEILNEHIKDLVSTTRGVWLTAGINALHSSLLGPTDGPHAGTRAQTATRTQVIPIGELDPAKKRGRVAWKALLLTLEQQLVLMHAEPGMLLDLADYLDGRTDRSIGMLTRLIRRGANRAIATGTERITEELLEDIALPWAAEEHARLAGLRASTAERHSQITTGQANAMKKNLRGKSRA